MKFKGDIIITDPCYIMKESSKRDDWEESNYGENMYALGFTKWITESTIYGDWSCTTYLTARKNVEALVEELEAISEKSYEMSKEYGNDSVQVKILEDKRSDLTVDLKKIGNFCADAGEVSVFLLSEVLAYNPEFDYHINRPWTTTLVKDFDGEVDYYVDNGGNAHIIGIGNVNFFTTQTGL